jgi:beta-lactamase class D
VDGEDKGLPVWNKDQDMKAAFANSTVWFYQNLARRIGPQRMQKYVREARYGNGRIGGGIDQFWLSSDSKISSPEQIDFLVRLHQKKLPFSKRSTNIVKRIMVREQTDKYVLRAKTGLVGFDPKSVSKSRGSMGWIVGYVERSDNTYFFATNLEVTKDSDIPARLAVTKSVLREMKIVE